MKYIVLVGDGMSGRPIEELNDRTVLEVAHKHYMDEIVKSGKIGLANTIPKGMTPASDVANLAILGYDPQKYYTGRGPLEAANIGVDLQAEDVAFRCNLVTQLSGKLVDYSAGHITDKEAAILIEHINKFLGEGRVKFYKGTGYRHLMVLRADSKKHAMEISSMRCIPPHDIIGKNISQNLPKGAEQQIIADIMERSKDILQNHDINKVRVDLRENPANMIWLWGQGTKPDMPFFKDLYGISGSIISAVDLIKGLGRIAGLEVIDVPGVTGYYDTNFKGKGEYALRSLEEKDFIFVHVEAPDEAGHNGDIRAKITAIENFDKSVVGTIWEAFKDKKDFRILVLPDHATPVTCKTHTSDPIPFAIYGDGIEPDGACVFTEKAAQASNYVVKQGHLLIENLIEGYNP